MKIQFVVVLTILEVIGQEISSLEVVEKEVNANITRNLAQDPPIRSDGGNERKRRVISSIGGHAQLTCPISCDPPCLFHWIKGYERINDWDRFDFINPSKSQLLISLLKRDDSGTYECYGVNGFGSRTAKIKLIVTSGNSIGDISENNLIKRNTSPIFGINGTIPEIQMLGLPNEDVIKLNHGIDLTLPCQASGSPIPNVTWYKDDTYLYGSRDNNNVSILKLTSVSEKDSGDYKCEAQNEFGKSIYALVIKVQPTETSWPYGNSVQILSLLPSNLNLSQGGNGSLTCTIRSEAPYPTPFLVWVKKIENIEQLNPRSYFHDGIPLEILNRTEVIPKSTNTYTSTLTFINVTKEQAGTYICCVVEEPMLDEFEYFQAILHVELDAEKLENNRQRAAQIQWTILWICGFAIVSSTIVLVVYQVYICRRKRKSQFRITSTALMKAVGVKSFARMNECTITPGQTISTTLMTQPPIEDVLESSEIQSTPQISSCHYFHRVNDTNLPLNSRRFCSTNVSDSIESYASLYSPQGHHFNKNKGQTKSKYPIVEEFPLYPLLPSTHPDPPPCTPVTLYSRHSSII